MTITRLGFIGSATQSSNHFFTCPLVTTLPSDFPDSHLPDPLNNNQVPLIVFRDAIA